MDWVREAIEAQEEHIKRSRSCRGQVGRTHRFTAADTWEACTNCGVTRTPADYDAMVRARLTNAA